MTLWDSLCFVCFDLVIRYWNINIQKNLYAGKKVKFFSLCEIFFPSFVIFQQQIMCLQDQKFVWISINNVIKFFQGYCSFALWKPIEILGLKLRKLKNSIFVSLSARHTIYSDTISIYYSIHELKFSVFVKLGSSRNLYINVLSPRMLIHIYIHIKNPKLKS